MNFAYTIETEKSIEEAITALETHLKDEKFGVLWTFDIKEKLEEKGFHLEEEFKVLEVCNPQEAERVLKEDKIVGYFLPCKIVVYKEGGKTKIGLPRPSALISMIDNQNLKEMATDIEKRIIACLEKSV
ncbi:DUF302 domain-containing protein [Bacillus sp. CMF12]|uniref:DUF302 domain-containing protein n=1 Tax=Bacillaceae TaxID=186817 RepID=UPI002079B7D2|nr:MULTISPECIES: DUF302 domain-containing protein [Bacillaceae]MDF2035746.1 DUF302 domain-containing protein [Cytobacillus oceanisediminis]USK52250.1 DUF302 domain-containing protein [Bacillus sp. CMF12]